jgi:sulfur transfer complex TusBCD TusB component (DsrH family)
MMKENLLIMDNEKLKKAKLALQYATAENIVQLCQDYLILLSEYRDQLYQLRGTPEICLHQSTIIARELIEQTRKAIRLSVEITTSERNDTELLLKSFTSINGFEAAKTFNQLKYKGFNNWELKAGGIRLKDDTSNKRLSIQEAVGIAGNLRREAYIQHQIIC